MVSLCVHSTCAIPASFGASGQDGEEHDCVRNYLLGFRRISEVDIFMQKNVDFCDVSCAVFKRQGLSVALQ